MTDTKTFYLSVTGIVLKDGKALITKRSAHEKAFPNRWTVPGGKVQASDYATMQQNAGGLWYEVLEAALRRELQEEVHLEVRNIQYVTSIAYTRPDGAPCVIISFFCDYKQGEVQLCTALTEHAWVDLEEAKQYDLIEGIYDELALVFKNNPFK